MAPFFSRAIQFIFIFFKDVRLHYLQNNYYQVISGFVSVSVFLTLESKLLQTYYASNEIHELFFYCENTCKYNEASSKADFLSMFLKQSSN